MIIPVTESWLPINNFPGYEISNYGKVRSFLPRNGKGSLTKTSRILKQHIIKGKPYYKVVLSLNGKSFTKKPHILVAEHFIGQKPSPRHEVRHYDGNSFNNFYQNLLWGTTQDNADDRTRHGTQVRGTQVHKSKLTEQNVREIKNKIPTWDTTSTDYFANKFGVHRTTILQIKYGNTWRHV